MNLVDEVDCNIVARTDRGHDAFQPEKKLGWNIILRAMMDYIPGPCQDITIYQSAETFLFKDDSRRPFSFEWLLDHLTQDPDYFQELIRNFCIKWRQTYRKGNRFNGPQKAVARKVFHNTINDGMRV